MEENVEYYKASAFPLSFRPTNIEDIPRYVSYVKASGNHGDRFSLEILHLNIYYKASSSKKVKLKDKLNEITSKLSEVGEVYPEILVDKNEVDLGVSLLREFEEILKSANK